jgi:hypothetical protein
MLNGTLHVPAAHKVLKILNFSLYKMGGGKKITHTHKRFVQI